MKKENLNEEIPVPRKKVERENEILINANHPGYEMTFQLDIDEIDCFAEAKLKDWPIMGKNLITQTEVRRVSFKA